MRIAAEEKTALVPTSDAAMSLSISAAGAMTGPRGAPAAMPVPLGAAGGTSFVPTAVRLLPLFKVMQQLTQTPLQIPDLTFQLPQIATRVRRPGGAGLWFQSPQQLGTRWKLRL